MPRLKKIIKYAKNWPRRMKTAAAFTIGIALIVVALLISACTKQGLTGDVTKETRSGSKSNLETHQVQDNNGDGSADSDEKEEVCTADAGMFNRIFSGRGSL